MINPIILTVLFLILLALFYRFLKNNQDVKNFTKKKLKQEADERAAIDRIFTQAPTGFLQDDYSSFDETQLNESIL